MHLKVMPFRHPELSALLEKSKSLAQHWEMGHVFMVLFGAIALVAPLEVVVLSMADPELTQGRAWDLAASFTAAPLLVSAIGFGVRQFARKRGRKLPRIIREESDTIT
jgi:hypothetical protein